MRRFVLVFFYVVGAGHAFFGDSIHEIKEFAWLKTITASCAISSPADMPVDLLLTLHTLQGAVQLRLTLSPVNTVNMPVYVIHNTGGNYTSTRSEPGNKNCGLYRDLKHTGAFACRRGTDGQFDIMGTMFLHGRQYSVWPVVSLSRAHIHVIRPVEEPAVRASDFVIRNTSNILSGKSVMSVSDEETVTLPPSDRTKQMYTVELVLHSDYKDFTNFHQRFNFTSTSDTISAMALWYAMVAELMTLTYETVVGDNPNINIVVKALSPGIISPIPKFGADDPRDPMPYRSMAVYTSDESRDH
ncbi:uncharacterized protein [Haliotis asinina]|uniref:uncharacterized protein n=1 Tax=Haliotis asinina TaxID=109174 RepID=UPI00353271F7